MTPDVVIDHRDQRDRAAADAIRMAREVLLNHPLCVDRPHPCDMAIHARAVIDRWEASP